VSDPIQAVPPSAAAVPRVVPVRPEPPVEPPKKSQPQNRDSEDYRESERKAVEAERRLSITRDENIRGFVYRSIEKDSGDIVWQFPAEEMLRRAAHLRQIEERRREDLSHEVDEQA
jgi:hypothetical protein